MLFNDLKYGKNSLFCCNGYSYAIFTILFYESQEKELRKAFTKEKKNFKVLILISNLVMNIVTKFQVFIFKNDEVRGGWKKLPPQREISWIGGIVE